MLIRTPIWSKLDVMNVGMSNHPGIEVPVLHEPRIVTVGQNQQGLQPLGLPQVRVDRSRHRLYQGRLQPGFDLVELPVKFRI